MAIVTASLLDEYFGRAIGDICPNGYDATGNEHNHCAHFVSHVLGYGFARTCHRMVVPSQRRGRAATRSVKEIFNRSTNRRVIDDSTPLWSPGLIFLTRSSNLVQERSGLELRGSMTRHMGIGVGLTVWHYSNRRRKVMKQSIASFLSHFRGNTVMVYGDFVPGTLAAHYSMSAASPLMSSP